MTSFTEIRLHPQRIYSDPEANDSRDIKTADEGTLEQLIAANTETKMREFTANWFPFIHIMRQRKNIVFEDEVTAASDTRELMLLVLRLKQMIDDDVCTKDNFVKLGAKFHRGGTDSHEQGDFYFLFRSSELASYLRKTNHCEQIEEQREKIFQEEHSGEATNISDYPPFPTIGYTKGHVIKAEKLYIEGQEQHAASLEDDQAYPVMPIFGGNLGKKDSYSPRRAYFFIDSIMQYCFQGVRIRSKQGVIDAAADTNFTSLWLCLSETFRTSRVTMCKSCGLPIIASNERGTKRLYCNDSCKRKYKRALKFNNLMNDGLDETEASKQAGIAAETARRIMKL